MLHKYTSTQLKVSILIPCWNEEASIAKCVQSCLDQTVKAHQIVVVDDCSSDKSPEILKSFGDKIVYARAPKRLGNKSYAQQYGLTFVTGDIVIATDGDTLLDPHFVEEMSKTFSDPKVIAASGYIKSLKNNWLTLCRAFEYTMSQNIHKLAQNYMGYMFVIPGAASAFRTDIFKQQLTFDHNTICEDLDWTYQLHKKGMKIGYSRKAIVYTQDPMGLHSYINQMRRWLGGGWQNFLKHRTTNMKPAQALEMSLIYIEGIIFAALLFIMPVLNMRYTLYLLFYYFIMATIFSAWAAMKEKRVDLVFASIPYMFLMYINSYIFLEQMVKEVFLKQRNLTWFQPERAQI